MAESLISSNQAVVAVQYFTSRVTQPAEKAMRQELYFQALESLAPVASLHFGKYLASRSLCRQCKHSRIVQSEKMTDVNVAVT